MDHEEAVIRAFILPTKRERYLEFLTNPKGRAKFVAGLAHFKHLDPRFAFSIPGNHKNPASLRKLLVTKGAGSTCWVISENRDLDGREMDLEAALQEAIGYQMGTFISCVPGKLAYFEDEDDRFILQR
ncbi:MAG: hypothetical protein WCF88_02070 [Candidatus Acidiferrales bacterium]|jgi:hypothetical protein